MPRALDADDPDDQALPCPQALLGATLALMSACAQPFSDSALPLSSGRPLLARKIVSNLFFLHHHPAVGAPLRALAGRLHGHWAASAQASATAQATVPAQAESVTMTDAGASNCPARRLH